MPTTLERISTRSYASWMPCQTPPRACKAPSTNGQACSLASVWSSTSLRSPPPGCAARSARPIDVVPAEIADRVRRYMRGILAPNLWRAETIIFDTRQTDHAAWIAGFILAQRLERITARDIVQSYRALRSPEERNVLDSTMDSLCVFGWLTPAFQRNDARPPVTWLVNPAVHIAFAEQAAAERARRNATKESIARHVAALREDDVDNVS